MKRQVVIVPVIICSLVLFLGLSFQSLGAQQSTLPFIQSSNGNWGVIYDIAYSPDGLKIAVSTETGTYILDENLQLKAHLDAHAGKVYSANWSTDGRRLVSGGEDATLRIWDMVETSLTYLDNIQTLHDRGPVYYVVWSPDISSGFVASRTVTYRQQSSDSIFIQADIKIWNIETEQVERTYGNLSTGSREIIWSSDGSLIASAGANGYGYRLWVWSVQYGGVIAMSETRLEQIRSITWKPNSTIVAVSDLTGVIQLFDVSQEQTINILWSEFGSISAVDWEPTGTYLAMGSRFSRFQIYNANNAQAIEDIDTTTSMVTHLDWAEVGNRIALILDYDTIRVYEVPELLNTSVPTMTPITPFPTETMLPYLTPTPTVIPTTIAPSTSLSTAQLKGQINAIEWSPDGSMLAVAVNENVEILDASLQPITRFKAHTGDVTTLTWSSNSSELATGGSEENTIKIWLFDGKSRIFSLSRSIETDYQYIVGLGWSPDGQQLVEIGALRKSRATGERLTAINIRDTSTWLRKFHRKYAFNTQSRIFWNEASTQFIVLQYRYPLDPIHVFDSDTLDSYTIASASTVGYLAWKQDTLAYITDFFIVISDGPTGEARNTYHVSSVNAMELSAAADKLAITQTDEIVIMDVATQGIVARLSAKLPTHLLLRWNPDNQTLVSANNRSTIKLWDVSNVLDSAGTPTITPIPLSMP